MIKSMLSWLSGVFAGVGIGALIVAVVALLNTDRRSDTSKVNYRRYYDNYKYTEDK